MTKAKAKTAEYTLINQSARVLRVGTLAFAPDETKSIPLDRLDDATATKLSHMLALGLLAEV